MASGYSLQYGASHPHVLVARAVEHEMDTLALTDRDGTYGAVKFAKACLSAGVRPVLGVDLAHGPRRRTTGPAGRPVRPPSRAGPARRCGAGRFRDPRLPRATLLAEGRRGGRRCAGSSRPPTWPVSGARPCSTRGPAVAELLGSGDLLVLLGPASELGAAVTRRRDDLAHAALAPWRSLVPRENLLVELVSHRLGGPVAAGAPAPPRTPPGWPGWPGRPVSGPCSPTQCATPTAATPPPWTSSTPPAGWSPSTAGTWTGATPRGSSSPARRWPRSPRRSAGSPGWPPTRPARPGSCWPAPARWRTGARSTPAPTWGWGRCTSRSSSSLPAASCPGPPPARARPTPCSAPGPRARSATATARRPARSSGSGSTTSWR
ncbi:PHP domain-containing protein [Nocardioides ungokensis]|uniref:PHP domain-containing protein n=1 Tax=Nocardioides ungokensis TaxID=1643322 RepID=UPI0015DF30A9